MKRRLASLLVAMRNAIAALEITVPAIAVKRREHANHSNPFLVDVPATKKENSK